MSNQLLNTVTIPYYAISGTSLGRHVVFRKIILLVKTFPLATKTLPAFQTTAAVPNPMAQAFS